MALSIGTGEEHRKYFRSFDGEYCAGPSAHNQSKSNRLLDVQPGVHSFLRSNSPGDGREEHTGLNCWNHCEDSSQVHGGNVLPNDLPRTRPQDLERPEIKIQ